MNNQFQQLKIQDEITQVRQAAGDEYFGQMMDNFDVDMQEMIGVDNYVNMPKQLDEIQFDGFDIQFES